MKVLLLPFIKGSNDLKSDIKSLVANTLPIFLTLKIKPSCFKTDAPLSMHFDANRISEVTTISSVFKFSNIHLSASSDPFFIGKSKSFTKANKSKFLDSLETLIIN